MTHLPPGNDWSTAPSAGSATWSRSRTRAAVLLWVLGGIELVGFGCCAGMFTFLAMAPLQLLQDIIAQQPMPEQFTVEQFKSWMPMIATTVMVLGVVPALVYLTAAFGVKAGKAAACNLALVVLLTQGIVLGVMLLSSIAVSIMAKSPLDLTVNVLMFGTPLALIVASIRALLQTREHSEDDMSEQTDPWNESQT